MHHGGAILRIFSMEFFFLLFKLCIASVRFVVCVAMHSNEGLIQMVKSKVTGISHYYVWRLIQQYAVQMLLSIFMF